MDTSGSAHLSPYPVLRLWLGDSGPACAGWVRDETRLCRVGTPLITQFSSTPADQVSHDQSTYVIKAYALRSLVNKGNLLINWVLEPGTNR